MRVLSEETKNAIAEYNIEYQKRHGISPSFRNIMHALNLNSLATVQRYVKQLEAEGLIERTNIGNIAPLPKLWGGETVTVPIIGQIACGEPCLEVENIEESFSLPCSIFGNSEMFMLRASGESMIDAGINPGDLLVIRRQEEANDGDIVVALVNGENTLKRIYKGNGEVRLHPENKTMKDIVVKSCEIQGVLVSCIKMY